MTSHQAELVDTPKLPATTTKATPKRLAEGYSEADSPSKRARVQSSWTSHR